jgi:hypothetical protein
MELIDVLKCLVDGHWNDRERRDLDIMDVYPDHVTFKPGVKRWLVYAEKMGLVDKHWDVTKAGIERVEQEYAAKATLPAAPIPSDSKPTLTKNETMVMLHLRRTHPTHQRNVDIEVSDHALGHGTVSHILKRLVEIGYVDHPGRQGSVLTDKGLTVARELKTL